MTPRRALWGLIVVSGLFRLAWRRAWGRATTRRTTTCSPSTATGAIRPPADGCGGRVAGDGPGGGPGVSVFSLRLGFVVLFAGSTWLMARLTSRFYGPRAGWFAALALNVTAYHSVAAGHVRLARRAASVLLAADARPPGRGARARTDPAAHPLGLGRPGLGRGPAEQVPRGLPAGGHVALPGPRTDRPGWLRRPGPYLSLAIGLLVFAPVIGWNAAHGWVSFVFQGGRALGALGSGPRRSWRPCSGRRSTCSPGSGLRWWRSSSDSSAGSAATGGTADRFLLCQAIVPLAMFMLVACTRPVLPHWTLVGFLSLFPMLGRSWQQRFEARPRFTRRLVLMGGGMLLASDSGCCRPTGDWSRREPGGARAAQGLARPDARPVRLGPGRR